MISAIESILPLLKPSQVQQRIPTYSVQLSILSKPKIEEKIQVLLIHFQGKLKPELAAITEELQEEISNQLSRFTAVMCHRYHHHQNQENIADLIG